MHKIPVGILGASGYAGRELCGLVAGHPGLSLAFATADSRRGERVRLRVPGGAPTEVTFVATDDARLDEAALVFSALPHGASATWVERARAAGAKVVDLSSDLRPGHLKPELLAVLAAARGARVAVPAGGAADEGDAGAGVGAGAADDRIPYGLPELFRDEVRPADVVANPGCYPTSVLVGLAPLAERGLLPAGATVSVAAASGVSGAGNSAKPEMLFGEVTEDYRAYGAGNVHRHLPEMRATLDRLGADVDLVFTPHLLPVHRGILSTMTVPVTEMPDDPAALWRERYAGEPFVEVAEAGAPPPTLREVAHRNVVRVAVLPLRHMRRPTLLVLSAVDNLVKGAAGQALQNANLMLGLDEAAGLPR